MSDYLNQQFGLYNRKGLVTGAGRGIGKAIACALAGAGAEVCVHCHSSRERAEETVAEIAQAGGTAWMVQADLSDSIQTQKMAEQIKERWGRLDLLVNNAGDLVKRCPIAELPDDLIETVLRVNLHTALYCIRACLPLLKMGQEPSILNLGSVAAHHGGGNGAVLYASTKGAIHTLTRGLAKEMAPSIRVNALAPGVITTDFHRRHSSEEALKNFAAATPLKRPGRPEEVAGAAVFLCSPAASFITGEIIEINGGIWLA
jgi:3-oxoacyl-[acyl-carrier protein] reductase